MLGAYVLAGELAAAGDDHVRGLRSYEAAGRDVVAQSREIGPALVETLIPSTAAAISVSFLLGPLLMALPHSVRRWLPLLPRRAVTGMRAVSGAALKDERPPTVA